MSTPLSKPAALAAEPSPFFCSTVVCRFHVTVGDANVQGFGDWATLEDGTTVSHRWVDGRLLCDLCAQTAPSQPGNAPIATGHISALRTADSFR